MSECIDLQFIFNNEYIGDSLSKINTNFQLLSSTACQLQQILDTRVNVRTFFYYGPNSPSNATEFDGQESKPSNATIERFINNEVKLPTISDDGDYAWVIYQRTGWRNVVQEYERSGNGSIPFTRIETFIEPKTITVKVPIVETINIGRRGQVIGYRNVQRTIYEPVDRPVTYWAPYAWSISVPDQYRDYAPIFVIYKLKYNASTTTYSMLTGEGFPKYSRAVTALTSNWTNAELWDTY